MATFDFNSYINQTYKPKDNSVAPYISGADDWGLSGVVPTPGTPLADWLAKYHETGYQPGPIPAAPEGGYDFQMSRDGGGRNIDRGNFKVDPKTGAITQVGNWDRLRTVTSDGAMFGQALAGATALFGGAAALGAGGVGAGGAGAVGGTGLSASTGSGLTLGQAGASGAGLTATGGSGLTLAGATGTGAGLAAGTGSGIIGAGIGASIPAGAVLSSGVGGATPSAAGAVAPNAANATNPALIESAAGTPGYGASSAGAGTNAAGTIPTAGSTAMPDWLKTAGTKIGGNLATQALLGGVVGAAAGSGGGVSTAGQQGVADTLGKLGLEQADIARDQYTSALERINANDPLFTQIIQNALTQQQQQGQRSDQLWNSYTANFLPAAEKFAQTAMNFDTPGRRAEEEARARAGVETEATMQRQAQQRALGRAGVSMDSGRALTLDNAQRLQTTKLSTGAADTARRNVEATGLNLLNTTAGIGQGIVGTSQQQAGQSLTAGNAATSTLGAKESARNATLAPTQAFYGGATSATGASGNVLNGVASTEAQNQASRNAGLAGLGSLAGTLLTANKDSIIGDWFTSDPKAKKVNGKVSGKAAVKTLADAEVYDYTYKPGMGDGGRHVGRMAGPSDPTGPDGMKRIKVQDEIGTHAAAIKQIAKDVKALKKTVATLADAR